MKANYKILVSCLMFLAGAGVALPVYAENVKTGEIDKLLKDEQAELQALRKKIARQENAIKKAGAKESTVLKNLQKIESQLKLKERELSIYQWNYKNNQKKILSKKFNKNSF